VFGGVFVCGLGELVFAVFAFVTLSIVIKACLYTKLVSTLGTFHNYRKYKRLNHLIILFAIFSFFCLVFVIVFVRNLDIFRLSVDLGC
jgi:hypothetical protein